MLKIRKASERGHGDLGWLNSRHSFSFAHYHDPAHMGFGALRVINDDQVIAGRGFGTHPHKDMEIISYVVEGQLEHKDSMGTGSVIRPGEVQIMSAGTGITHSEYNPSKSEALRFLQIWIIPDETRLRPGYEQKNFSEERRNALRLVVSKDGDEGSLRVHQDLRLYASLLDQERSLSFETDHDRKYWLQVVSGSLMVNDEALEQGDGLAITSEEALTFRAITESNFLLFDLKDKL